MRPRHGLVIGKFYPPHAGHHHLVRAASRGAERVTVVVMAATVESLALADRVAWMREVHAEDENVTIAGIRDDHPVDLEDDAIWRAHVALMQEAARSVTDEPVDAVFSSEAYGDELARRLGARHIAVDPARMVHRVSGTAVRADPVAHWGALAPCVRGHLAAGLGHPRRVREDAAAGPQPRGERRGQRGLPRRLGADQHDPPREVTAHKLAALGPDAPMDAVSWGTEDFVDIAREQARRELVAARAGAPVLVCDTDAFATGVWHERYQGEPSRAVDAVGGAAPFHLYLLTHHDDVPFEQDGLRDGEHVRAWMTEQFVRRLGATGRRWQWLRGTRDAREAQALAAIDALLAAGWNFAAPLG